MPKTALAKSAGMLELEKDERIILRKESTECQTQINKTFPLMAHLYAEKIFDFESSWINSFPC